MIEKLNEAKLLKLLELKSEYKRIYEEKPKFLLSLAFTILVSFILTILLIFKNYEKDYSQFTSVFSLLIILAAIFLIQYLLKSYLDKRSLDKEINDHQLEDYIFAEDALILKQLNHLLIEGSRSRDVIEVSFHYDKDTLNLNIKDQLAFIKLDENKKPLVDQYQQVPIHTKDQIIYIPEDILNKQLKLHNENETIRYEVHYFEFYKNKNLDKVKAISQIY